MCTSLEDDLSEGTSGEVPHIATVKSLFVHSKVNKETSCSGSVRFGSVAPFVHQAPDDVTDLPDISAPSVIPSTVGVWRSLPE